ncbi:hypothetical protein [Deinococcus koreensis]|nr:hypothetical protein [Deinococcus koreensis]
MSKSPADAYLHHLYAELLAFYAHFLASPEGESAPRRQDIEVTRNHTQELADGAPCTPGHQICLIDASRHLHAGIGAAELGYLDEGAEVSEAVNTVLRHAGAFLAPYATHQGSVVQHVVTKLQGGVGSRGQQEVAALIALLMHGVPVKVVRPRRNSQIQLQA